MRCILENKGSLNSLVAPVLIIIIFICSLFLVRCSFLIWVSYYSHWAPIKLYNKSLAVTFAGNKGSGLSHITDVHLADLEGGGVICIRFGDGGRDRAGGGDEAEAEGGEGEVQQHGADAGWWLLCNGDTGQRDNERNHRSPLLSPAEWRAQHIMAVQWVVSLNAIFWVHTYTNKVYFIIIIICRNTINQVNG